jgi:inner membrane protein
MDTDIDIVSQIKGSDGIDSNTPQRRRPAGAQFGLKALIIIAMSLVLLIPVLMLGSLVNDRKVLAADVTREIEKGAGGDLEIAGPFLVVSVEQHWRRDNEAVVDYGTAIILPRSLTVNGTAVTETRSRGIYTAPVFDGTFDIKASFNIDEARMLRQEGKPGRTTILHWESALLAVNLSGLNGLRELPVARVTGGKTVTLMTKDRSILFLAQSQSAAIVGEVSLSEGTFDAEMTLKAGGGGGIRIAPLGRGNVIRLAADWPTPNFIGDLSPVLRDIDDEGFTAEWKQPVGVGSYPEYATSDIDINGSNGVGVELFKSVDVYHKTDRALKYALLFIIVPFIVILLFEVFARLRIHPIQYALIGFADVVFYTLLLSFAEQWPFLLAYILAAAAVIALISVYAASILKSAKRALILAPILALLYAFLYSALQSRDYALLIGSLGVFGALAVVMLITRNVDWYTIGNKGE